MFFLRFPICLTFQFGAKRALGRCFLSPLGIKKKKQNERCAQRFEQPTAFNVRFGLFLLPRSTDVLPAFPDLSYLSIWRCFC